MSRHSPYQNPTVPPQGFQPIAFLAVRALRSVLERPDEFLAAFFSSIESSAQPFTYSNIQLTIDLQEKPPCSKSSTTCQNSMLLSTKRPSQPVRSGSAVTADDNSLVRLLISPRTVASVAKNGVSAAAQVANDSHQGGAGEWGCAVTPPLCPTDWTLPSLLEEQAG